MKSVKSGKFRFNKYLLYIIPVVIVSLGFVFSAKLFAEQSGSSPDSGTNSRIKDTYNSLVSSGYGSESSGSWGDWGSMWNRIKSAATWTPVGTATAADVISGKTFYSDNRTLQTGTANASADNYQRLCVTESCDIPITWTTTSPGGGTAASVTDNGTTRSLTSNKVLQDPYTRLYWTSKSSTTFSNEFAFVPGDNPVNPTDSSCNLGSPGTPNQYCDNQDPGDSYAETNTVSAAEFCLSLQLDADNADGDNNGLTGVETDWRLPTVAESRQAFGDGLATNLTSPDRFWTATEYTGALSYAYYYDPSYMQYDMSFSYKSTAYLVYCVRN